MTENVQTTAQLCVFHMLARSLCSKSFKLGFSSTWTKNIQVYNMDLEKTEESEIKLPTSSGWEKNQGNSRTQQQQQQQICFIDYFKAFV